MLTSERTTDPAWFRDVLGQYPTGVTVITAIGESGAPVGMAVGSFTSVSLDPPLVAFLPSATSNSWASIRPAGRFCVNVLASDQEPVCRAFASKTADKFAGLDWRAAGSGSPILAGAVAWIDCDLEAVHEAGDHHIVIGRVRDLDAERLTAPLVFFQGGYGRFSASSLAIRDERFASQLHLVDRARPLMERAAARLGVQVVASHCDGVELTLLASAGSSVLPSAGIGQRVPVAPPVAIWWMAFAPPATVDGWLGGINSESIRDAYRAALVVIRERGFCLGLGTVQAEVEAIISRRATHGAEPTIEERAQLQSLALDPMEYVPTEADLGSGSDGTLFSLWAPVVGRGGEVPLGVMLTGSSSDGRTLRDYADALLALATEIAGLEAT